MVLDFFRNDDQAAKKGTCFRNETEKGIVCGMIFYRPQNNFMIYIFMILFFVILASLI